MSRHTLLFPGWQGKKTLSTHQFQSVKKSLVADWESYLRINNTQSMMDRAADFAEGFALRAYDSVHLAAADLLAKQVVGSVTFTSYDHHLNRAAHLLGVDLLVPRAHTG